MLFGKMAESSKKLEEYKEKDLVLYKMQVSDVEYWPVRVKNYAAVPKFLVVEWLYNTTLR